MNAKARLSSALLAASALALAACGGDESSSGTVGPAGPVGPPYIEASAMMLAPGSLLGNGSYSVAVCADPDCAVPVPNATVSIDGTPLTWDAADEDYGGAPSASIAGRTLELVVAIPAGSAVAGGTYRASGTMYTEAPALTSPTSATTWSASTSHTMTWTPGAPTGSSLYVVMAMNMSSPFAGAVAAAVPVGQSSYVIAAGTLTQGSYLGSIQITPATGSVAIPNTQGGSGFTLMAGDIVLFNVAP